MAVEGHVFQVELFFVFVLVDEGSFEFAFATGAETLNLDLFGEVYVVTAQQLEDGFLGAPVDGQLFVSLLVFQILVFMLFALMCLRMNRRVCQIHF